MLVQHRCNISAVPSFIHTFSLVSKLQGERQSLYDITPHKHDRVQGASAPAICEIISKRSCISSSCAPECQSSALARRDDRCF